MKRISLLSALCSVFLLTGCPAPQRAPQPTVMADSSSVIPSHFQAVGFDQLPGWREDDVRHALVAFRQTCRGRINYSQNLRVIPDRALMEEKCNTMPPESASVAVVRQWFENHFQPFKVRNEQNQTRGVFTGYYIPTINACRRRTAHCNEPLMALPRCGRDVRNIPRERIVREQMGEVLFWANLVDVQHIQIQGTGRIVLEDGTHKQLNFAAVNDMPFRSLGEQLRQRGIRPEGGFTASGVMDHLRANPALAREVINNNPRYVWFQVAAAPDIIGALNVPLTRLRSIAIDNTIYSLGLPVWVDTQLSNGAPFRRLMIAQDTGGAIRGWIRVDLYFGEGPDAHRWAEGQFHRGEKYIFMPRVYRSPVIRR